MRVGPKSRETDEYQQARLDLLNEEVALRDHAEKVAQMRRDLPAGPEIPDYELTTGVGPQRSRLSDLFTDPNKPLVIYQFMYGGKVVHPCPMCSMWIDGYQAVEQHVRSSANTAVIAEADISDLRAYAHQRGWKDLQLASSKGSGFKIETGFGDEGGMQWPGVTILTLESDTIRHFYSGTADMPEDTFRGMDLLSPTWNILDLLPGGRGDYMPPGKYVGS